MIPVRHRVFEIARWIGEFKERHELQWELVEGLFILAAFGLVILGWFVQGHFDEWEARLTWTSHVVVFLVLLMHWGAWFSVRYYVRNVDHTGTTEDIPFVGVGSVAFPTDLGEWAAEYHIFEPLDPARVSFATFDDLPTLEACTAVLDRIVDRDNFPTARRAALYRRWLYSGQAVLAGFKDETGKMVCASVVLPLTEDAFARASSGALDAIEIESWDIEPEVSGRRGYRYLLVDAVARLEDAPKGLGTRLALYHCSKFFDPEAPPLIMSSTKVGWLQMFFSYLEFKTERDKRDTDIVHYSADFADTTAQIDPAAGTFRTALLSTLTLYRNGGGA